MDLENASLFLESHESHDVGGNSFAFLIFSPLGHLTRPGFQAAGVRGGSSRGIVEVQLGALLGEIAFAFNLS